MGEGKGYAVAATVTVGPKGEAVDCRSRVLAARKSREEKEEAEEEEEEEAPFGQESNGQRNRKEVSEPLESGDAKGARARNNGAGVGGQLPAGVGQALGQNRRLSNSPGPLWISCYNRIFPIRWFSL